MKKILAGAAVFIAGIACGLILTCGPVQRAQAYGNENSNIMAKLADLARGQADIMAAINSIKGDLQIIKIRVTQSQ